MPGGSDLKAQVLDSGICSLCGACLDWCPYLKNLEDRLVMPFDCKQDDGRCYKVCPRTFTDWKQVHDAFLDGEMTAELGSYTAIHKVRSRQAVGGQQDGGTVSMLLKTALEEHLAEVSLMTGSAGGLVPQPILGGLDDIRKTAGSRFLVSPGLRKVREAQKTGVKRAVAVGRPCQVQAARKFQLNLDDEPRLELLVIGLFCMWSLNWDFKDYLERQFPGETIGSVSIPRHAVQVQTGAGVRELPTGTVKEFIAKGCSYCLDMTAELADISVGAFEIEAGWNTVIIRSQAGKNLFDKAMSKGYLEVAPYPESELAVLKTASFNKKAGNLRNVQDGLKEGRFKAFVDLSAAEYQQLIEGTVKS